MNPAPSARRANLIPFRRTWLIGAVIMAACLATGCSDPEALSPGDMNQAYESALASTDAPVAALFPAGSHAEQRALERLESYFAAMTVDSVEAGTLEVYATDAWLYDNLAIVQGAPAIRDYFVHSASATRSMRVEFLQTLRDGIDYFVRWKMTIDAPGLADGAPMVSYGMTQFRFDADGRVLLHRDFWDAATGLYEYLPGVGGALQGLRARIATADPAP